MSKKVTSVLHVYNLRTGESETLTEFDHLIEAPNWTRDGARLIFNAEGKLHAYTLATGEVSEIDSGFCNRCNNDHVLCDDGLHIAVSHHTAEDGQSRIYRFSLADGTPTLITPMAPSYLHGWSPDGSTLAYCASRNGQYDVYTIPACGGVETQLTNEPGLDDGPEFSPDGSKIWFNSVRTGLMQVFCMNTDGSAVEQMTNEASNNWFPHVSPDGRWVVYIAYRVGDVAPGDHPANKQVQLRLMRADGGESRLLVSLFGGQGTINVNSWAPDSQRFAYVSYRLD